MFYLDLSKGLDSDLYFFETKIIIVIIYPLKLGKQAQLSSVWCPEGTVVFWLAPYLRGWHFLLHFFLFFLFWILKVNKIGGCTWFEPKYLLYQFYISWSRVFKNYMIFRKKFPRYFPPCFLGPQSQWDQNQLPVMIPLGCPSPCFFTLYYQQWKMVKITIRL